MKIYKFFSPTCGPCKVLARNLEKANVAPIAVDITDEDNAPLVEKYQVKSIPTLVIESEDGKLISKSSKLLNPIQITDFIKEAINVIG